MPKKRETSPKTEKNKASLVPQIAAALTGCMGGFCLGTVIGWSSPAGSLMKKDPYNLVDSQIGWVSSLNTLGSAFSVLPLPFIMDVIGRKYTMMVIAIGLSLSWVLLGAVSSFWAMLFGRLLCGFFSGSFCVVSPVYTAEVVEPRIRGALGSCFQLFIVIGICIEFALGLAQNMYLLAFFPAACPIVMIALLIFLPDSPLFLINSGKDEETVDRAYRFLRGKNYDFSEEKYELAKDLIESDERKAGGVLHKFKNKATIKGFIICISLNVAQQISGINVIMYFAGKIFEESGTAITPDLGTTIMGIGQIAGTLLAVGISDRAGRKILLLLSFGLMSVCLLGMGFYSFFTKDGPENYSQGVRTVPVIVTTLYVIVFSIGAGPLVWAVLGEMFSPEVKSVVSSICAFSNWFMAFIITVTFQSLLELIQQYGAFWLYSACGVLCVVFIAIFVIETKGKTLKEIQIALGGTGE